MSFHTLFGFHHPDLKGSRWQQGHFVTECTVCGAPMEKLPGGDWQRLKR